MAYFPFYVDLKNKDVLLVGAGNVAFHKLNKLVKYECKITVVAKEFSDKVMSLSKEYPEQIECIHRSFSEYDICGKFCVITATSDEKLNAYIYKLCHERNVLVNSVDDKDKCDFIFSSTIQKGNLSIGVSSGGASPVVTTLLKQDIEKIIPDNIENILIFLENVRRDAKLKIHDNILRKQYLTEIAKACYTQNRVLSNTEIEKFLIKYNNSY